MNKISYLANLKNDNKLIDPVGALDDARNEILSGAKKCDKLLVLTLDTSDKSYHVGFYSSRLKTSEMLALTARFMHIVNGMLDGDD